MNLPMTYLVVLMTTLSGYAATVWSGAEPFSANTGKAHLPAGVAGNRNAYPSFWLNGFGGK